MEFGAGLLLDELALQAAAQQAVQFIETRARINGDAEDAAGEAVQAGMTGQVGGEQLIPEFGELAKLFVRPFNLTFERFFEKAQAQIGLATVAPVAQTFEAALIGIGRFAHDMMITRGRGGGTTRPDVR